MNKKIAKRPVWIWITTAVAILFGLATLKSGGQVLFIDGDARQAAGDYVPFVLWFNFTAGFAYVMAGGGLWGRYRWAAWLSMLIAASTLLVFAAFGIHILNGGLYEVRTVVAMSMRSLIWIAISFFAYRNLIKNARQDT